MDIIKKKDFDYVLKEEIGKKIEKLLEDIPLQINFNVYLSQEQNPELININDVERAAIAIKDSNAVENARNSAIAQEKSSAVDNAIDNSTNKDTSGKKRVPGSPSSNRENLERKRRFPVGDSKVWYPQ